METKENTSVIDKAINALRNSAVEMEEFQVTLALGKAEAKDKFEEMKKQFDLFIHESKSKVSDGKEKLEEINVKIDELRVQLALGKADTLDAFQAQKKDLLLAIHEIEVKIRSNETLRRIYSFVMIEFEKFKVQLELLQKKYESSREDVESSFEKGKNDFDQFVERLKNRFSNKKEETKWEHFQSEVSEAFTHLKQAFKK